MLVFLERVRQPAGDACEREDQLAGATGQIEHVRHGCDREVDVRRREAARPGRGEQRLHAPEPRRTRKSSPQQVEKGGGARIADRYLMPDVLIEATRGSRKSHTSSGSRNGAIIAPDAPSTCSGMSHPVRCCTWSNAAAISATGS